MNNNFWKNLKNPILALAPMAGFTDSAFRQICEKYGADVVYSEMASVSALFYNSPKTLELLKYNKTEKPYVVQLFGSNPLHFSKAVKIISQKIKPQGIDINFGCPVRKVMKQNSGCALMNNIELSRKIIPAVSRNTNLPVSIKIRAGIKNMNALKFIEAIKDLNFSAVMIHCRTYEEGFAGIADYSLASRIKKIIPDKIVLANGGIYSQEEAAQILKKYNNIDGLGIARGALGKPFIFEQIKDLVNQGKYKEYDFAEIKKIILEHAQLVAKNKKEAGIKELRKHLVWYVKGFPGASDLRKKLIQVKNSKEIKELL